MSDPAGSREPVEKQAVCLGCGCLCDDVVVRIAQGSVVSAAPLCERGKDWLLDALASRDAQLIGAKSEAKSIEGTLDRLADLLFASRAPLICGLEELFCEGQQLAVELARKIGAMFSDSVGDTDNATRRHLAELRAGTTTASWGEVRARAELILFWWFDPGYSHPRYWDRFVEPPGKFIPEGRRGRTVLIALSSLAEWSTTVTRCDGGLIGSWGREIEILTTLRSLVRGHEIASSRIESATGLNAEGLRSWATRLRESRYTAIVVDYTLASYRIGQARAEALFGLANDLNERNRCVVVDLVALANASGAASVLTSQVGSPCAVDFAGHAPRFLPGDAARGMEFLRHADLFIEFRANELVVRGEYDTRLSIPLAIPGLESGGTVLRSDDVALRVPALIQSVRPTAETVLRGLISRLDALAAKP